VELIKADAMSSLELSSTEWDGVVSCMGAGKPLQISDDGWNGR